MAKPETKERETVFNIAFGVVFMRRLKHLLPYTPYTGRQTIFVNRLRQSKTATTTTKQERIKNDQQNGKEERSIRDRRYTKTTYANAFNFVSLF